VSVLLPLALMLMQVGVDPNGGRIPGIPDELRNRPPRGAVGIDRAPTRPAIEVCLSTAEADPAKARALAEEWVARTAGAQRATGRHCLGVAASNAGDWSAASAAFLSAREEASDPRFRARMGLLAGVALLAQNKPSDALAALAAARGDATSDAALGGEMAIERAVALVALDRLDEASAALDEARRLRPEDPAAWLLSATLARRQGAMERAQQQIERAAALDPRDPAIGLEAGVIAALAGNPAAARKSFESVIAAAPGTALAESARAYLGQLGS
jgi:tetratricopeptide (TPR) repeat protein